jgi:hypothetical protein
MKFRRRGVLGVGAAMLALPARAQDFPSKKADEANVVPLVQSGLLKPE